MSLPFAQHFNACLPRVPGAIRITSLTDAQVFTRRWCIRDRDRELKALLKRLERANSSDQGYDAIRDFKKALMARGLFPGDGGT
jgi:hypothetical protein